MCPCSGRFGMQSPTRRTNSGRPLLYLSGLVSCQALCLRQRHSPGLASLAPLVSMYNSMSSFFGPVMHQQGTTSAWLTTSKQWDCWPSLTSWGRGPPCCGLLFLRYSPDSSLYPGTNSQGTSVMVAKAKPHATLIPAPPPFTVRQGLPELREIDPEFKSTSLLSGEAQGTPTTAPNLLPTDQLSSLRFSPLQAFL